ncbi:MULTISPECIES: hypothetical protein [unclassified Acinetobacter]|uniref:hypothetical protein n=1 Tax=unclassified Acinetobacter TaxID=196816 RepID=UPI000A35485B|nr:hypothetical protein [Acinetobacter sp. ANC 4218]OTG73596.1 hypothetical protein B9T38_04110 [Acinetobacter sp. ANC 4218]
MSNYPLPQNVRAIADCIGKDKALALVGQLKRTPQTKADGRTRLRCWLYIPKVPNPKSPLVQIIGWADACKLTQVFNGETISIESCRQMATDFLHRSVREQFNEGIDIETLAVLFGMNPRSILKILIRE